jgi:hypothetical protein
MTLEEAVITINGLKEKVDNYYGYIQTLQRENAEEKDLILNLENKLRIKRIWAEIWAWVSALLAALLAIKCF